jgi:hypothetical protein
VREREKARGSGPYGPLFGLIAGMVFVFRGPCARPARGRRHDVVVEGC